MRQFNLVSVLALLCLFSCSTKEQQCPTCLNGATCIESRCECPPGYTGEQCQIEKTPAAILISAVKVTAFPATDINGAGWDITSGPDIKLIIKDSNNNELYKSESFYQNATAGQVLLFTPTISTTTPSVPLTFQIVDYDDGLTPDDFIGGIVGAIFQPGQGFPQSISMNCPGCVVSFQIDLVYYF